MGPWTFEVGYRYYTQGNADFYSDLFERANQQNFLARDKELSTFVSQTLSVGATYDFLPNGWRFIKKGTLNLRLRPHRVRVRRLPRRALLAAAGRRSELPRGRHRAALHVRRQRHPGVRVGLVLRARQRTSRSAAAADLDRSAAADPFPARDLNPLLAGFGLPSALPARLSGESWSVAADFNWASTSLAQRAGAEQLIVDAETREMRVTIGRSWSSGFAAQLEIPYRYTGGGVLD